MEEVFPGTLFSVSLRRIGDGVLKSGLRAGILCSISVLLEAGGVGRGSVLGLLVMVDTEFLVDNESGAPQACDGALGELLSWFVTLIMPFLMAIL